MEPFKTNIEESTLENDNYRKVIYTGQKLQLVLMSLRVGEDIPLEVHNGIDQFIRIESGEAKVEIEGEEFILKDDDVIIIPSGKKHYVCNNSDSRELKLYSIYAGPEHKPGTIHKTAEEAREAEHEHD